MSKNLGFAAEQFERDRKGEKGYKESPFDRYQTARSTSVSEALAAVSQCRAESLIAEIDRLFPDCFTIVEQMPIDAALVAVRKRYFSKLTTNN